jgi:hypothetical protein
MTHLRYEVMRQGGTDVGVVEVLEEPVPASFDPAVLERGAREARAAYKAMFRDVDAAIMMPGANTSHPAYLAMQDWLKDDLAERRGRRTIHFHWVEGGSAYAIAGQPLPARFAIDRFYQRALLETDYQALGDVQRRFERHCGRPTSITSPAGTDPRFRVGDRPSIGRTATGRGRAPPAPFSSTRIEHRGARGADRRSAEGGRFHRRRNGRPVGAPGPVSGA